jgi:hypothetical protein
MPRGKASGISVRATAAAYYHAHGSIALCDDGATLDRTMNECGLQEGLFLKPEELRMIRRIANEIWKLLYRPALSNEKADSMGQNAASHLAHYITQLMIDRAEGKNKLVRAVRRTCTRVHSTRLRVIQASRARHSTCVTAPDARLSKRRLLQASSVGLSWRGVLVAPLSTRCLRTAMVWRASSVKPAMSPLPRESHASTVTRQRHPLL